MELLRTPFYELHLAAGGRMVPFAGYEMPVQYSGVNVEHAQVRRSVGLFDVSHMGEVRVTGPRALEALQWLLSNDVSALTIGHAQYSAMCNEFGGVVDDVFVYRMGESDYLVCVNAANRAKDFAWMLAHQPCGDGAVFVDQGEQWAQLAIQGRNALATVAKLTTLPVAGLPPRGFYVGEFAGISGCIIARTGYTGEDGFEIFIPANRAAPAWSQILNAGAEFGILPIGLGARDTLRLEVRNCLYGHELDDETSPLQANLGWITKLDKPGGFLGRDAIAARKGNDSLKLCGLVIDGSRIAREGMPVLHEGVVVGRVTSGTKSPTLEKSVAMAFVPPALATAGVRLIIDVRGREAEATVVAGPFYKRDY